jgi:hypothetical protein
MSATTQQVHVDAAMTQISVDFSNEKAGGYINEGVWPVVNVKNASDFAFYMSKQKMRRYNTTIGPGSDFPRIQLEYDKRLWYYAEGHGAEISIPDQIRANADPAAQLDIQCTKLVTETVLIDQEYNLAVSLLGSSGALTTLGVPYVTLSGSNQWSDYNFSDPLTVVENAKITVKNAIAAYPNAMAISDTVFVGLRNHPKIREFFKYVGAAMKPLSVDQLREYFGLKYLFVGAPVYQTAVEGATDALGPIWGKNAYLFYRPDNPGLMEPAFGYTFLWTGQGFGQLVARYREQWKTQDVLQVQKYYSQTVVTPGACYAWLNAVA